MPTTEDNGRGYTADGWYVYRGEDGEAIAIQQFVAGDNGGTVAKLIAKLPIPREHCHKNQQITRAEIDANALLLAASSDLLEAAKLSLAIAESWIHDQLDGTASLEGALEHLKPARAAIAKATATP